MLPALTLMVVTHAAVRLDSTEMEWIAKTKMNAKLERITAIQTPNAAILSAVLRVNAMRGT